MATTLPIVPVRDTGVIIDTDQAAQAFLNWYANTPRNVKREQMGTAAAVLLGAGLVIALGLALTQE